jgi:hypothetical protein
MMKSKRAEEFIRNSAFSAIQLPGEVMYSIHMNVEGKLLDRKSAERAVELAERDAEEEIEMLKARAVEAHRDCCMFRTRKEPLEPDDPFLCEANYHMQGELCDQDCGYMQIFIQKLNEQ